MREQIIKYLLDNGFEPSLKGFRYLIRAIEIGIEKNGAIQVTKDIYPTLGKEFYSTEKNIEKSMRYAIQMSKVEPVTVSSFVSRTALEFYMKGGNKNGNRQRRILRNHKKR